MKLLTLRAAADRLGISARTVRRWAQAGRIPVVSVGRRYRILDVRLEQWAQGTGGKRLRAGRA